MESNLLKYIKLTLAILFWGGVYHIAKYMVKTASIAEVALLRYGFAALLFAVYYVYKKKTLFVELRLAQVFWLVLIGLIGIALYNIIFLSAEANADANFVAILLAFTPCITTILGIVVLKDRVSILTWSGLILALFGAVFVVNLNSTNCGQLLCSSTFSHLNIGQVYAMLAAVIMALYGILNPLANRYAKLDSLTINTYASIFGFVFLLIYWNHDPQNNIIHLFSFDFKFWLALAYVVVLGTVVSYLWFVDALLNIGVEKTVVFQNGVPFFTVLIGLFLGETVSFPVVMCGGLIILGVLLTNFAKYKR